MRSTTGRSPLTHRDQLLTAASWLSWICSPKNAMSASHWVKASQRRRTILL